MTSPISAFGLLQTSVPNTSNLVQEYANLQNLAGAQQVRQQQIAESQQAQQINALKLEQAQTDIADQNTIKGGLADAQNNPQYQNDQGHFDFGKYVTAQRDQGKIGGDFANRYLKSLADQEEAYGRVNQYHANAARLQQEADDAHRKALQSAHDAFAGAMQDVKDAGYDGSVFDAKMNWLHTYFPQAQKDIANALTHIGDDPAKFRNFVDTSAASASAGALADRAKRQQEARTQAGQETKDIAAQLGTAENQDEYNSMVSDMASSGKHSLDVLAPFVQRTPEQARLMGMTSQEQEAALNPKEAKPPAPTEASLSAAATYDPTKTPQQNAEAALERIDRSRREARPPAAQVNFQGLNPGQLSANQNLTGEEYLATLPASLANQIRQIGNGYVAMPSASSRAPGAQAIRDAVFHFDPDYNDQRAQLRKSFAGDKQLGNINTAVVHLDQFAGAANALANGTFRPGNEFWNALGAMFGNKAPTNFLGLRSAVSGEMASALKGNATDQEIKQITDAVDSKNSPEQLRGYIKEMMQVLGTKMNTYKERFQAVAPNDKVFTPVLPSSRAVFNKWGIDPLGGPAGSAGGGQQGALPRGRIKVKRKSDGATGNILESDFDPKKYDRM